MLRRRPSTQTVEDPAARTRRLLPVLRENGWVLPAADATWTAIGTVGAPSVTRIDARGLIDAGGWSLDWWIGAEDRWHLPSKETAVRQHLVGDSPVVETLVRIPSGDAVQRAYGIRGAPHPGGDEYVVVEIENRSKAPFAVALVVRPFSAGGVSHVGSITVEPVAGGRGRDMAHLVRIDGRPALVLPRRPARAAASDHSNDVAGVVLAGGALEELPAASCEEGLAQAAFVVPVPHAVALRLVLPIGCAPEDPPVVWPPVIPDGEQVASGWAVQARRGVRIEIPDPRLTEAFTVSRRFLLLAHGGDRVSATGEMEEAPSIAPRTPIILRALGRLGLDREVRQVLETWPEELIESRKRVGDEAVLDTVAEHWRLTRDRATVEELLPEVAAGLERIGRADRRHRLDDPVERRAAQQGVRRARQMLEGLGQPEAATQLDRLVERLANGAGPERPAAPPTAGPGQHMDAVGELAIAASEISAGETDGLARLLCVLDAASPTWTWAPGPDLAVGAALIDTVLTLLVTETDDGLALLPVLVPAWYGGGVEVHDLPTAWGCLSFAVRWHDSRPAVLWDLRPHPDVTSFRITCPGLDPTWSTDQRTGDALLAVVNRPPGPGDSFA